MLQQQRARPGASSSAGGASSSTSRSDDADSPADELQVPQSSDELVGWMIEVVKKHSAAAVVRALLLAVPVEELKRAFDRENKHFRMVRIIFYMCLNCSRSLSCCAGGLRRRGAAHAADRQKCCNLVAAASFDETARPLAAATCECAAFAAAAACGARGPAGAPERLTRLCIEACFWFGVRSSSGTSWTCLSWTPAFHDMANRMSSAFVRAPSPSMRSSGIPRSIPPLQAHARDQGLRCLPEAVLIRPLVSLLRLLSHHFTGFYWCTSLARKNDALS